MVLIVGCGYIGKKTASLLKTTTSLVLTARSKERINDLQIDFPFVYSLDTSNLNAFEHLVHNQDAIILTMAAGDPLNYKKTYLDTAEHLEHILYKNTSIKQIIYTSSSSVYGDCKGKKINEEHVPNPMNETSKILLETEKVLLSLQSDSRNVCIFRVSEIYGPDREISKRVKSLEGKKAPGDGFSPTNMIHQSDVAKAILFALKQHLNGIYNLCDNDHYSRMEMYDKISQIYNLPKVMWDPHLKSIHQGSKILSNDKIKQAGFCFDYPKREWI